jgi:hypothetical protein
METNRRKLNRRCLSLRSVKGSSSVSNHHHLDTCNHNIESNHLKTRIEDDEKEDENVASMLLKGNSSTNRRSLLQKTLSNKTTLCSATLASSRCLSTKDKQSDEKLPSGIGADNCSVSVTVHHAKGHSDYLCASVVSKCFLILVPESFRN